MKRIFTAAIGLLLFNSASAQTNYFNTTGNVGLGTNNATALLNLNWQYAQIKMQGANSTWLNSDIVISRLNSGNQLQRSPNIAFVDDATSTAAFIQSYQGNLQFFPGGAQSFTLQPGGKVGILNSSPQATFQIETSVNKLTVASASAISGTSYIGFNAYRNTTNSNWRFDGNGTVSAGSVIYGDQAGNINFAAVPSLNGGSYFEITDADLKSRIYFQVSATGMARAKKLKIETANFPDYVFSKEYKLPSLNAVALFIEKNHRLPEMPAAKDVHADGLDVGEMNKLLVKKVEELTLYLIEHDKRDKAKDKRLAAMQRQINKIKKAQSSK
ncbi:hypothetical protein [Mucilaginibacter sp.]|uniref:hypothetical protein n=1 Tax=Mucilaginibacter sp. TaxID=1882438 RepID=UPI0032631927